MHTVTSKTSKLFGWISSNFRGSFIPFSSETRSKANICRQQRTHLTFHIFSFIESRAGTRPGLMGNAVLTTSRQAVD